MIVGQLHVVYCIKFCNERLTLGWIVLFWNGFFWLLDIKLILL